MSKFMMKLNKVLMIVAVLAVFPFSASAASYGYNYIYTTPAGSGTSSGSSSSYSYDYSYNNAPTPAPTVSSLNPNSTVKSGGQLTVGITGNNFNNSSVAQWNGSPRPTTYQDSRHLLMHLNPGDISIVRTNTVSVMNQSNGMVSNGIPFYVNNVPAPVVSRTNTYNYTAYSQPNYTYSQPATVYYPTNYPPANYSYQNTYENYQPSLTTMNTDENLGKLGANLLVGHNGFMPSGLIQWLIMAIIVLAIVIIIRRLVRKNYETSPLKHA